MTRYIDADDAIKLAKEEIDNGTPNDIAWKLETSPPADVVERKWILCSERLPEERAKVLTWISSDDDYELNHVIDSEDGEWFINGVVAWMPLPEPYKSECEAIWEIQDSPSADAVARKRGEWYFEEFPDGYYHSECSECGHWFYEDAFLKPYNYCPNCGADMKGDKSG